MHKRFSEYSKTLIWINVGFFLIYLVLRGIFGEEIIDYFAIKPASIIGGQYLWTFITSMFLHAGFGHLIVNMISLMFIGSFVEMLIGKKRFLWLYFTSGILAGLLFVGVAAITGTDLNVYAVGASGAIFGLGGLLAVLTPRMPVLVFFIIPLPMWMAMIFLILALWALSLGLGIPIGNIAHLGGLIGGVLYGLYLRRKYPEKTKIIGQYFAK